MKRTKRYFIKKEQEAKLPKYARLELRFLRDLLRDAQDEASFHLYCRTGDDIPRRLERKFKHMLDL